MRNRLSCREPSVVWMKEKIVLDGRQVSNHRVDISRSLFVKSCIVVWIRQCFCEIDNLSDRNKLAIVNEINVVLDSASCSLWRWRNYARSEVPKDSSRSWTRNLQLFCERDTPFVNIKSSAFVSTICYWWNLILFTYCPPVYDTPAHAVATVAASPDSLDSTELAHLPQEERVQYLECKKMEIQENERFAVRGDRHLDLLERAMTLQEEDAREDALRYVDSFVFSWNDLLWASH